MEATIQQILKKHEVWTEQLELELLRYFEKLRLFYLKDRHETQKQANLK